MQMNKELRWITLWQCQTGLTSSEISSMAWDVYLLTAWAAAMAGVLIPESSTTSKRFPRLSIWKDFTKSFRMSHKITAYECLNTDYTLWSNTGRFFSPPSLSHQRWIVLKISLIVSASSKYSICNDYSRNVYRTIRRKYNAYYLKPVEHRATVDHTTSYVRKSLQVGLKKKFHFLPKWKKLT